MPIWTYTPLWDAVRSFYEKFEDLLPPRFTGLAGIRLHRTGNPLTFEIFGRALPEKTLYPLLLLEIENGKLVKGWDKLENDFDIPWVKPEDFHVYRTDVMALYHADDLLEPAAEAILKEARPSEEMLRKALVDHAGVLAGSR